MVDESLASLAKELEDNLQVVSSSIEVTELSVVSPKTVRVVLKSKSKSVTEEVELPKPVADYVDEGKLYLVAELIGEATYHRF